METNKYQNMYSRTYVLLVITTKDFRRLECKLYLDQSKSYLIIHMKKILNSDWLKKSSAAFM